MPSELSETDMADAGGAFAAASDPALDLLPPPAAATEVVDTSREWAGRPPGGPETGDEMRPGTRDCWCMAPDAEEWEGGRGGWLYIASLWSGEERGWKDGRAARPLYTDRGYRFVGRRPWLYSDSRENPTPEEAELPECDGPFNLRQLLWRQPDTAHVAALLQLL